MSKTKLKIAIEQRKYGVCGEGIAAMYVCVKQGDVQEGHRVDDGCHWLNWEDRGWEGLRKKKGRTPSAQELYWWVWTSRGLSLGRRPAS